MSYAGFWKRFVAWILDTFILLIASFPLVIVTTLWLSSMGAEEQDDTLFTIVGFILGTIVRLLYFALMESSPTQATLGKMAVGIKVTDLQGNPIILSRAITRNLAKLLSALIFDVGYIMAGFTSKKQALHDVIADCLVVNK